MSTTKWPEFSYLTGGEVMRLLWQEAFAYSYHGINPNNPPFEELYSTTEYAEFDYYLFRLALGYDGENVTFPYLKNKDIVVNSNGTVNYEKSKCFLTLDDLNKEFNGNLIMPSDKHFWNTKKFPLKWAVQRAVILDLMKMRFDYNITLNNTRRRVWRTWRRGEWIQPPLLFSDHQGGISLEIKIGYQYDTIGGSFFNPIINSHYSNIQYIYVDKDQLLPLAPFHVDCYLSWYDGVYIMSEQEQIIKFKNFLNDGTKPGELVFYGSIDVDFSKETSSRIYGDVFRYNNVTPPDSIFKDIEIPEDHTPYYLNYFTGMYSLYNYSITTFGKKFYGQPPGNLAILGK